MRMLQIYNTKIYKWRLTSIRTHQSSCGLKLKNFFLKNYKLKEKFADNKNVLELVEKHSQIFSDFLMTFFESSISWLFEKSKILKKFESIPWPILRYFCCKEIFTTVYNFREKNLLNFKKNFSFQPPFCFTCCASMWGTGFIRDSCRIKSWDSKTTRGSLYIFYLVFSVSLFNKNT